MKKNVNELSNLGDLANRAGAQMVSVSNVIPYSKEMIDEMVCDSWVACNNRTYDLGSVSIDIPVIDKTGITNQALFKFFTSNNNISIMKNKVRPETPYCRFIKERCTFVRWDGKVSPCMGLLHSYKTYFSMIKVERNVLNYTLGDIQIKKLKDIWDSKEYLNRKRINYTDKRLTASIFYYII
jgi:MoaA/NifB/PqqE/SkfB family radical SAM enzyme